MFFDFIEIELGGDQYKSRSFHSISPKIAYDSTVKMDKNETLNYQIMQKNQPIFNGTIEWSANLYEYISAHAPDSLLLPSLTSQLVYCVRVFI